MNKTLLIKQDLKCPSCDSDTLLYLFPHDDAGLVECTNLACGYSDMHQHTNTRMETIEFDTIVNGEPAIKRFEVEVCKDCGLEVDD